MENEKQDVEQKSIDYRYLIDLAKLYEEISEEFKIKNPDVSLKYIKKAEATMKKYNEKVSQ
jgi:hypothetical protein